MATIDNNRARKQNRHKLLPMTTAAIVGISLVVFSTSYGITGMASTNFTQAFAQAQPPMPQQNQTSSAANITDTVMMPFGSETNQTSVYYVPNSTQVQSGMNVTWVNNDTATHTATAGTVDAGPSGEFDTGLVLPKTNGTAMIPTTVQPGTTIPYYCMVHPWMSASLTVASQANSTMTTTTTATTPSTYP